MGDATRVRPAPAWRGWVLVAAACAIGGAAWAQATPLAQTARAAQAAQAAATPTLSGPARCRFLVPAGMPGQDVRWTGRCRAGLAQGRGSLRAYEGGKLVQVFYGRLEAGQPVLGVVDLDGGFKAGRFEAGQVVNDGDRATLIQAFDEASAAARQIAAGYRQAGNAASARFYRNKAQQLSQQMD